MTTPALMRGISYKLFDAVAATTAESTVVALLPRAQIVTAQVYFGTEPSAVEISIGLSNDGENFAEIVNSTTTGGSLNTFQTSAKFIKAEIVDITDGDDITVEIVAKPIG